jgi:hypothetical protein
VTDKPLRARLAPFVPLRLTLAEPGGAGLDLELRLAFNFNVLAAVEEASGLGVLSGQIWQQLSARTMSILFWASLLPHQPEYEGPQGLAIVRSYMDAGNAAQITRAVTDAFILSLPAEQQVEMRERLSGNPTPPPDVRTEAPAGSSSGPSPDLTSVSRSPNSGP